MTCKCPRASCWAVGCPCTFRESFFCICISGASVFWVYIGWDNDDMTFWIPLSDFLLVLVGFHLRTTTHRLSSSLSSSLIEPIFLPSICTATPPGFICTSIPPASPRCPCPRTACTRPHVIRQRHAPVAFGDEAQHVLMPPARHGQLIIPNLLLANILPALLTPIRRSRE